METLRLEQIEANEALRPSVAPERVSALCERLRELADEAEERARPPVAEALASEGLADGSVGNGSGALR